MNNIYLQLTILTLLLWLLYELIRMFIIKCKKAIKLYRELKEIEKELKNYLDKYK